MPEEIIVNASCTDFQTKSFPLEKKGSVYEFSFKLPATSSVIFFSVSDSKENAVDNNSGKGYVVYLKDPSSEGFEKTLLEKIRVSGMAVYFLKLDYTPQDMLSEYESLFEDYPYLKNESTYATYLLIKFQTNKEETRAELIEFAKKMAGKDDEKSLTAAYSIFSRLDMNEEKEEVEKVALEKYPTGEIARTKFMMDYFSVTEKNDTYISDKINEYIELFGEPQEHELDFLYLQLITALLDKKDTLSVAKYKDQITDKDLWVSIYNSYAWKASGMDLSSAGTDLDFAEQISRKSLDIIEYQMAQPGADEDMNRLEETHRMCADTYALILYKQKKYDLAFRYQHEIVEEMGNKMYADGKERYAAFAEKAKGPEFAKEYLEKELLAGTDSKVMVEQLQRIYSELNLPEDEFENIQKQYLESAAQKDKDEIIEKYGDIKAIDFTLANLEDQKVSLSDYTGKVVILDFWALWCGPCISSFPGMQELVNKFENDNVEFFFINSWESSEPEKTKEKVMEFLEEKGYNFNVLFDYTDEVITKYKIRGIPTRILIDKSGNMKTIIRYTDDLLALINESL